MNIAIFKDQVCQSGAYYDAFWPIRRDLINPRPYGECFVSTIDGCFKKVDTNRAHVGQCFDGLAPTQESALIAMCPYLDPEIFGGMTILVSQSSWDDRFGLLVNRWFR